MGDFNDPLRRIHLQKKFNSNNDKGQSSNDEVTRLVEMTIVTIFVL